MVNIPCRLPSRVNHRFLTDGKDTWKFLIYPLSGGFVFFFSGKIEPMLRLPNSLPSPPAQQLTCGQKNSPIRNYMLLVYGLLYLPNRFSRSYF